MSYKVIDLLYRPVTIFIALILVATVFPPSASADTIYLPVIRSGEESTVNAANTVVSAIAQLAAGTNPTALGQSYGVQLTGSLPALGLYRYQGTNAQLFSGLAGNANVLSLEINDDLLDFEAQQRIFNALGNDLQALSHYFGFGRGIPDPTNTNDNVEGALVVTDNQTFTEAWRLWGQQKSSVSAALALATGVNVTVAVLDTGVDLTHPALAGRLLPGYDFVQKDNSPQDSGDGTDHDGDGIVDEAVGHGTHVAGVIAAVAPQAKILPVRVLHSDGGGVLFDVVQGIAYAVEQGAKVINLSFSASTHSPTLEAAINYALNHGVVVVAAAAGDGAGLQYPAAYPGVIAVGATQKDGFVADFSESYAGYVDVFAPGEMIYSSYRNSDYAWWSGSSMAAPFVAGLSALLVQKGGCVPECIVEAVTKQVDTLRPNAGSINFQKAVQNVKRFLNVCLLVASDKGMSNGFSTINQAASSHGVTSYFLINADRASQNGNPAMRWNEMFAGDVVRLSAGALGAEGWFFLPTTIQYADSRTTNLTYQQWVDAFVAGTLPQDKLDKVRNVKPLGNHDLEHLVGKTCVAVVHKGVSINQSPLSANLQGDRLGLFSFTVLGLDAVGSIPESGSSSSLKVLRVRVESPLTPTAGYDLLNHH